MNSTPGGFPLSGKSLTKVFFDKEEALAEAQDLADEDYETHIGESSAFSTLGWFNDPVLSTTLQYQDIEIVNTVLHEILHSTVWIPGHVTFNESLANFVGTQAAVDFYYQQVLQASKENRDIWYQKLKQGLLSPKIFAWNWVGTLSNFTKNSSNFTTAKASYEEKLKQRDKIFDKHIIPLREKYSFGMLKKLNNAELLQLKIYMTRLPAFDKLYQQNQGQWPDFYAKCKQLK